MVVVDSSVFVALERGRLPPEAISRVGPEEEAALAAITASELLAGVHRADTPERALRREAYVESILESVPVLPFDLRVARVHARLSAELARRGQNIGAHDLEIAATALAHDRPVLTANPREFARVPGLTVRQLTP